MIPTVQRIAIFARNPTISKTIPKTIIALQGGIQRVDALQAPADVNVPGRRTQIPRGRLHADVVSRTVGLPGPRPEWGGYVSVAARR
jgi:hypothetical protein